MKKRSVIITGCSSGIGRYVAVGLREKGYRVFATARKKTDVNILVAEGFESVQLDLANSASINSAFQAILEKLMVRFTHCLIMLLMANQVQSKI